MRGNNFNLGLILVGGILLDVGVLYFYASRLFAWSAIIIGSLIFLRGFTRLK